MDFAAAEDALSRRDVAGLARELAALYPDDPELDALPDLVRFALLDGASMPRRDGSASLFVASIAAAKNFWLGPDLRARAHHRIAHRVMSAALDFLGDRREIEDWTAARALNHLVLKRIRPSRRAAVVCSMRDDGIYALEWIAHYQALGFEGIFIYTNDNADGSEHLLRRLAGHGVITLVESETAGTVRPEVKAFEHALNLLHDLRDYEWVLFVDSDEFFQPGAAYRHCVANVLDALAARFPSEPPSAVVYEWLWFNSGMVFERRPGLLLERFQHASPHWLTKPLVRVRDATSMRKQHIPELCPGGFIVNSAFERLDAERVWERRPPQYAGGRINHYWPKSFEEFSLKKARGDALPIDADEYRRGFKLFFEWNGPETPETHHPVDTTFLGAVKSRMQRLRGLDGIAAIEADVEARFNMLVARYGLREIYRRLKPASAGFGVPTSA
jgi:hypothetical protein